MNERIRELAEQANIPVIDGQWDYNNREILIKDGDDWRVALPSEIIATMLDSEKGLKKFAELIVRSAMDYASRNWEHGHLLAEDLRVYFGVEE